MSVENRSYWKEDGTQRSGGGLLFGLPPIGRVVKYLLILNVAVFVLQQFFDTPRGGMHLSQWFGATVGGAMQVWRYVTFQFLHAGFWHIALNMLGLYLLGSPLEQYWGPRRFLAFYLSCGAFAGVCYVAMGAAAHLSAHAPIVGASGGIYGILLACAVLFPHFRLILFIFPVPIRLALALILGGMAFLLISSWQSGKYESDFWSQVAHMGGVAAAAGWLWIVPRMKAVWGGTSGRASGSGAWRRKMDKMAAEQAEIDRILQKIHDHGIASLTHREKKHLQEATRRQQRQERESLR